MTAQLADYRLGPDIIIKFVDDMPSGRAWWEPQEQVLLVDRTLDGRELAVTLLHEVGHMLCADHDEVLSDADHEALAQWAGRAASLLNLLRPGRRAVCESV